MTPLAVAMRLINIGNNTCNRNTQAAAGVRKNRLRG